METKSLEQKITEEISKHRYSTYELNELLNISKTNPVIADLFKEFSSNNDILRLLTLHRLDLFGFESDIKSSLLLYCNLPKNIATGNRNNISNALKFIINEKVERTEENGLAFMNNMIGNADAISEDFKDVICYFLIDLLRNNPNILELANGNEFTYNLMKAKLKNYENTLTLSPFFEERISNFRNSVDPEIRNRIEKIALQVVGNLTAKVEEAMEGFNKIAPDFTMYFHKQSILWLTMILERTELDEDKYTKLLDFLFRIKAAENKHIVTWCENCNKQEPTFQIITGKIVPSNLKIKRECVQCQNKKHYSFSSIYALNPALKDILDSKDGLLATYMSWLADKRGMSVECSKHVGVYETDILINKKYLIECKNFKIDKDENALMMNVKKSFAQLERQIVKFKEEGIDIEQAFLLWNLDTKDVHLKGALDLGYKNLREKYGFKIISYNEVNEFVNTLK